METKPMTRAKAIRAKCLDCCGGNKKEVRLCTCDKCPLFPYRMGRRISTAQDIDTEPDQVKYYEFAINLDGRGEDKCR